MSTTLRVKEPVPLLYGVVILAAGSSRRMGRPKLLLPWGTTTVLGHLIRQWEELSCRQIGVVCAPDAELVQTELNRLHFPETNRIINPAPERGMFSSIQCAATWPKWKADITHWVITLGDQPQLRLETLRALLQQGAECPNQVCQPLRNGRRRHPVLLPRAIFAALAGSPASDLKQFLETCSRDWAGFEANDLGLDFDLDEPADYERAKKLWHYR